MKSKGFTIIELVVVIVIMAILAATAAPKFLNLKNDAKIAALEGFISAFITADDMVVTKATIAGVEDSKEEINIPNTDLYVYQNHMSIEPERLKAAMSIDGFTTKNSDFSTLPSLFVFIGDEEKPLREMAKSNCYVQFSRSVDNYQNVGPIVIHRFYDNCQTDKVS